ncbi:MAG TPA: hypothetical protein VGM25_00210 [Caulobacteraceae bacterium]|jgi:hypothetical protein
MFKPLILAAGLAAAPALAFAQPAATAGAPPAFTRYAGTVTAVDEDHLTIRAQDGKTTEVPLSRTWTAVATRPVDIEAIKPGSFVATANTDIDATTGKSIELRVFEPGNKGGEGSRPMAQAHTTMTNATVQTVTKGAQGRELVVAYPGGTRHIIVPPDVKVIGNFPIDRDTIKPGDEVTALATKGDDGVTRATRVQVARK